MKKKLKKLKDIIAKFAPKGTLVEVSQPYSDILMIKKTPKFSIFSYTYKFNRPKGLKR